MPYDISRRDFLNGVALTIAAGLTPAAQIAAQPQRYPPALMGLRGAHPGSFETAHERAREGKTFPLDALSASERHDLIVVGGGISGLAAAWFYRRKFGPQARILILDNHDDFGGHAKRNEFSVGGRLILGYGGSESMQAPKAYSAVAKDLLGALGIRFERFETAFERDFYPSLGLSRGIFFPRETFGRDALVTGDPTEMPADDLGGKLLNARPVAAFVADFPVSDASKAQLLRLYEQSADPLPGKSNDEKLELLKTTSYRDYLLKILGCGAEVANCFQGRTLDYFATGADSVSADEARQAGFPGFAGLGLPKGDDHGEDEPYIHHFPDGNASIARLLVRDLVPGAAPGNNMDDIVLAPFDYAKLDREGQAVRLRLDSTAIHVRNTDAGAEVAYARQGVLHKAAARHVVLACFNMVIPHIMPELPQAQREALASNVKAPLVHTKVMLHNWHAWVRLAVHEITAPMSFHNRIKLDYPVSLGGYEHPRDPAGPIGLHLVHVPDSPNQGLEPRDQFRIGRMALLETTFADFETRIRQDLDRMLGPGGFSSERDIAAITVNRWPHGYAYTPSTLFDKGDNDAIVAAARAPMKNIAIANSDAGWNAYANTAIDEADRAVRELLG